PYLPFRHSKNCAVKENVFPAGQLGMKPSSDFQQARDAAFHPNFAPCRRRYSRQDFQKRAFACAVSADYSKNFALLDLKRDPAQRPDFVGERAVEFPVISYLFPDLCPLTSALCRPSSVLSYLRMRVRFAPDAVPPSFKIVAQRPGADHAAAVLLPQIVYFIDRGHGEKLFVFGFLV